MQEEGEFPSSRGTYVLVFFAWVAVTAVALVCVYGYFHIKERRPASSGGGAATVFAVKEGDGANRIAAELRKDGLVADERYFLLYVWEEGLAGSLKAGKYLLHPGLSPKQIADKMAAGDVFRDVVSVTVPEGFTLKEIRGRFSDTVPLALDTTIGAVKGAYDFFAGAPDDATLEGFLFPDTYHFERDVISEEVVVQKMLSNFGKKIAEVQDEIARQRRTVYETLIMASIIEREVKTDEDMALVSGILWKRIMLGMPLQVDASVIYAVGHNNLSTHDLAVDSPYNTYRYKGLPKGPIANPGMRAIRAALAPEPSDYLFYISKPDGETVFSRTLAEHKAAIAKYLK